MKLIRVLEDQRVEEAFARKTYGSDNPPPPDHEGPFRQRVRNMMMNFAMSADDMANYPPGGIEANINRYIPEAGDDIKQTVKGFVEPWYGWHKTEGEIGYAQGHPGIFAVNDFIEDVVHMETGGLR